MRHLLAGVALLTAIAIGVLIGNDQGQAQIEQRSRASRLSALSTTVVTIVASRQAGLVMLHCNNTNATTAYVQLFDVATSGGVTLGTTLPILSFAIPGTNASGFALAVNGIFFGNGIQIAATTTATGLTALGTALDCNASFF